MRKRALSWAAAVIGAVALMVLISGCDGAEGVGILNAILPDGITEPAGIVPTATGSLTVTTGGQTWRVGVNGGNLRFDGNCSSVELWQSPASGTVDREIRVALNGCDATVTEPYIRITAGWLLESSGCVSFINTQAMVWEGNLSACGVGGTTPQPPNPPSPPQPPTPPSSGIGINGGGQFYGLWFDAPPSYGFTVGGSCQALQNAGIHFWKDGAGTELFGNEVSGGCHFNLGLSGTTLSGGTISGSVSGQCYVVSSTRIEFYGCGDSGPPDDGGGDTNVVGRFAADTSMFIVYRDGTIRAHGGSGCSGMPLYYEASGQSGVLIAEAPCTWRLPASVLGQNIYIWLSQPDNRRLIGGLCITAVGGGKFLLSGCFGGGGYNPPPSYGSCGGAEYDTNRNGFFDDPEIVDAVKIWILTDPPKISDNCIVIFVKKWIRGEQVGAQGDDSPFTQGELTKIRQTLGDGVADLLIRMEQ